MESLCFCIVVYTFGILGTPLDIMRMSSSLAPHTLEIDSYSRTVIAAINRLIKEKDIICYGALNYMAILNQRQGEKLNKLWDTIRE